MITLTVTSFKGKAAGNAPVSFDELGGTIGRADTNQLVLPDPERTISRIHAQLVFRGGAYALIGRGGNAVLHNGSPLGHGAEVMLAHGDQIVIGNYEIAVSTAPSAAPAVDPFEAAFPSNKPARPAAPAPDLSSPLSTNPVRLTAQPPRPAPRPASRPAASSGFGIPDDWDPFAKDHASDPFGEIHGASNPARAPGAPGPAAPAAAPLALARNSREDSIDALFGLGAPSGADPFAASPLAQAPAAPNTGSSADPMRSLQQPAPPPPRPEADHVSDLNSPWANAPKPSRSPAPGNAPLPGPVLSWDVSSRAVKIGGKPAPAPAGFAPVAPAATVPAARTPAPATVAPPSVAPAPAAQSPAPSHASASGGPEAAAPRPTAEVAGSRDAALLEALCEGLGTPDLRIGALSPELMRQLGQLLRESTKGTVELLAARAALKREVRADVTTILASANNSLKFSPSVEVALQYLLGPKMMGFMPPVESMRDAFDDLKAHQLGVMAGMKAALAGVLERFDPKVVEGKLTANSGLSSLLPSSRKARLWELFQELYQKLATEAEDDFNTLFGAAFLKAYQQYIDQLEGRDPRK